MDPERDPGQRSRPPLKVRLQRLLRPPRILRPTRAGWCFFVVIFAVAFAALNTGNNLLYLVLSLMLAFLVLSGVLSESALRGIEVRRRLPRELFAQTDNSVVLEIHNAQRRVPAFAVVIEDRWVTVPREQPWERDTTAAAGRTFALRIEPGGSEVRRYRLHPEKRGRLKFAEFRVSTRCPFGLFLKSREILDEEEILVYPALEPVQVPPRFAGTRDEGERASAGLGDGT
ncbi:MAG: hypothetical protein O7A09_14670, partial [Proteobacteria bacterium]|nr:hypothetical protein [Pseudomonadota bacterium]